MAKTLEIWIHVSRDKATRELAEHDLRSSLPSLLAAYPSFTGYSFDIDVNEYSRPGLLVSFFGLWNFSSIAGLEKILVPMADRVRDKLGDEKIVINNADAHYRLAHAHPGQPLQLNMSRIH